nr:probable glutamate receptor [Penaeus vannamei]
MEIEFDFAISSYRSNHIEHKHKGNRVCTKMSGPAVEIMKNILEKLDLCYEFVVPPDGLWGSPFPNGSWFGMMGMLQRKEVDVAVGPFAVTRAREAVADFSIPIFSDEHVIFFRRPRIEPDLFGFIKPLGLTVWTTVLASLFIVTAADLVLFAFDQDEPSVSADHQSWLWGFMLVGQVQLRQGSRRGMVALWLLTAFIIASVYKSNLKAMLIVPKVFVPFDSLEEMVDQRDVPWIIIKGSIIENFFEVAYKEDPSSVMGRGWAGHQWLSTSPLDHLQSMFNGYAGMVGRYPAIYRMSQDFGETGTCRLMVARKGFIPVTYSFGFPQNSELIQRIDPLIYKLKEFGIIDKFLKEDTSNATQCLKFPGTEKTSDLRPLALGDFYGVFCLYAVGKCRQCLQNEDVLEKHLVLGGLFLPGRVNFRNSAGVPSSLAFVRESSSGPAGHPAGGLLKSFHTRGSYLISCAESLSLAYTGKDCWNLLDIVDIQKLVYYF